MGEDDDQNWTLKVDCLRLLYKLAETDNRLHKLIDYSPMLRGDMIIVNDQVSFNISDPRSIDQMIEFCNTSP